MQFFQLENFAHHAKEIPVTYVPAVLKRNTSEGWFIEYYVFNPFIDKRERRRTYLNCYRKKYRTLAEFKAFANEYVLTINMKLMGGWTPLSVQEKPDSKEYTPLSEVCMLFLQDVERELSVNTLRTYKSYCDRQMAWINANMKGCKVGQFSAIHANSFMREVYNSPMAKVNHNADQRSFNSKNNSRLEYQMSANTYNGILKCAKAFWSWCIKNCYVKTNPFEKMSKKKENEKFRDMIPQSARKKIIEYIQRENPDFEIIYHMVMISLIRPVEISRLQVCDIDLEKHCICLPSSKTKNGKTRIAPLTDRLCELLKKHIEGAPQDYYLFDSKFKATAKPAHSDAYGRWWSKMRQDLGLDERYQLYSLRDTGMNTMMTECGLDPVTVMETADHSDLSITTKYIKHFHGGNVEKVRAAAPAY